MLERLLPAFGMGWDFCSGSGMVHIHELEGYAHEDTSGIDFERVAFGAVGPRT